MAKKQPDVDTKGLVWVITKNGVFKGLCTNPGRAIQVVRELSNNPKGKPITASNGIIAVVGSNCFRIRPILPDRFVGSLNQLDFASDLESFRTRLYDKTKEFRDS